MRLKIKGGKAQNIQSHQRPDNLIERNKWRNWQFNDKKCKEKRE